MARPLTTLVYPASDLAAATALFTALTGTEPYANESYYVGFRVGEIEIGLDPHGPAGGPIGYWAVDDIQAAVAELVAAGATTTQEPRDVGGGMLVATLTDAGGTVVGLRQTPGA